MFGMSVEEVAGKEGPPSTIYSDRKVGDEVFETIMRGDSWIGEIQMIGKNEHKLDIFLRAYSIKDDEDKVIGLVGVHTDITDLKKAEQEMKRLYNELEQKNKELEQVVYVTSHDLRTPLVNIEGFSKELKLSVNELIPVIQSDQLSEEVKEKAAAIVKEDIPESLKYISASINKMDLLLTGLLKLSRLGRSELNIEEIDMNRLISEVISIFKSRISNSDIKLEISELPACKGDEMQMNQIFSNLIDNSIKYLDVNHAGIIRISGYREDGQSVYCVQDNGIGFDSKYKEKIFDIFHRLEPANYIGEGLGLTIIQKALERQNGRVWVESERGKGSKFYISLPGA